MMACPRDPQPTKTTLYGSTRAGDDKGLEHRELEAIRVQTSSNPSVLTSGVNEAKKKKKTKLLIIGQKT